MIFYQKEIACNTAGCRVSKKWLNATFSSFFHPVLAPMARSAPNAKNENLWVFIRSDAHVVRAGLNIRGLRPLINPRVYRHTERQDLLLPFVLKSYLANLYHRPSASFARAA